MAAVDRVPEWWIFHARADGQVRPSSEAERNDYSETRVHTLIRDVPFRIRHRSAVTPGPTAPSMEGDRRLVRTDHREDRELMEPSSGGLEHRTEPLELTTSPSARAGRAAQKPRRGEKALLGAIVAGSGVIAGIGFTGSYTAVRRLAEEKGFSWFSYAFPVGVDVGIAVILALDVYLTWKKMAFWPLRMIAWMLTAGTIAFNAAVSWPDPVGTTMHALIPVLFVIVVEAARHVVRRTADLADDRHMDSIRWWRWVLSPVGTFRMWRRMKLWEIRSYDEVVRLERARVLYRKELRIRYGRKWRSATPIEALRPLRMAGYGIWTETIRQVLVDAPELPSVERPAEALPVEKTVVERIPVSAASSPVDPTPSAGLTSITSASASQEPDAGVVIAAGGGGPAADAPLAEDVNPPAAGSPLPTADDADAQHARWEAGAVAVGSSSAAGHEFFSALPDRDVNPVHPGWQELAASGSLDDGAPAAAVLRAEYERDPGTDPGGLLQVIQSLTAAPLSTAAEIHEPLPQPVPVANAEKMTPFAPIQRSSSVHLRAEQPQPLDGPQGPPVDTSEPVPVGSEPEGEPRGEQQVNGRPLSKKDRARLIYEQYQREGRELSRGTLARLAGYAHEGSARTVYKELEDELGPIVTRPGGHATGELAASGARS
ncbi:DUF2637 domain-containing protein [Kitasatospora sp. NPDC085879]|uniref:DUF2637 domain-containing protein n=1 Tax=Kitasatospora sp. NPDC085879 TaxID=3154769 RepID=UPI0034202927